MNLLAELFATGSKESKEESKELVIGLLMFIIHGMLSMRYFPNMSFPPMCVFLNKILSSSLHCPLLLYGKLDDNLVLAVCN